MYIGSEKKTNKWKDLKKIIQNNDVIMNAIREATLRIGLNETLQSDACIISRVKPIGEFWEGNFKREGVVLSTSSFVSSQKKGDEKTFSQPNVKS